MAKIVIKRRHTEAHPQLIASSNGKVRDEVIAFLKGCGGECELEKFLEHCDEIKTILGLNYSPRSWYTQNPKYIKFVKPNKLKLTRAGGNFGNILEDE